MAQRVLQNTAATITETFYVDGVPTDPSPATTTAVVTRSDGTTFSPAATRTAVGTFALDLTTTNTSLLDTLRIDWTSSLGTIRSHIEIVGGFLFSVSDARALKPLDNATTYPASKIVAARTLAEQALEDACGVAFVPRYATETVSGWGGTQLLLSRSRVTKIRSVTIDGVALTSTELADLRVTPGFVYRQARWTTGYANVTVGYEHGHTIPPARVSRAALLLAKRWLVDGPVDDRMTSMSTEDGTFTLLTPGLRGAVFDLPEVEAVRQQYSENVPLVI